MALTTRKNYDLIVWWENPTETFVVTGGTRQGHVNFVVQSGTHASLWTLRGIIQIDTTTAEEGTFWLKRDIIVHLNRDPNKTRRFDFKFYTSDGIGYGALDFVCQVNPYGGFTGDGVYTYWDFFTGKPPSYIQKILLLPPQEDSIISHPLNISWTCSGQWACKFTAEFELSALLE